MKYRNEWKHVITYADRLALRQRLSAVASADEYAGQGGDYSVRSLYFDSPCERALRDKIDSLSRREKFRIRYYNNDTLFIRLEKKSKISGRCLKQSAAVTAEQTQAIIDGDIDWLKDSGNQLLVEFYSKLQCECLKPKTIVEYEREAFVYAPGNVRVTIDSGIRTGLYCTDFLNPQAVLIPAGEPTIVLEVKWDEFLPDVIRSAVRLVNRRTSAFSKYQTCRIYG